MKVADILKLTAAGYKVADIKELSELEKSQPEAVQIAASCGSIQDVKDLLTLAASEDGTVPEGAEPGPAEREPEPDYKKMYEALKGKTEALEGTLKQIQDDNSRKDLSGKAPDLDKQLADIMTSFM